MCHCRFVEYRCTCTKPDCPHLKPKHPLYHADKSLFQIDHFEWQHCTRYLACVGLSSVSSPDKDSSFASNDQSGLSIRRDKSKRKSLKSYLSFTSKASSRNSSSGTVINSNRTSVNYQAINADGEALSFWSETSLDLECGTVTERPDSSSVMSTIKQPSGVHLPVRKSRDPRHGSEMPECESISYEGWCIERRECRGCEDYWKRRESGD